MDWVDDSSSQWEFQDPIDGGTVPYFWPYFWGDIPLHSPYIALIYGRYLHFRILKFPLIITSIQVVLTPPCPPWVAMPFVNFMEQLDQLP